MFVRLNQNYKLSNQYNMNGKMANKSKYMAISDKELRKTLVEPIML
jgi:hypothetical protein